MKGKHSGPQVNDACKDAAAIYIAVIRKIADVKNPDVIPPIHFYPNVTTLLRVFAVANPSVCLSVVCNVGAPYSGG